MEKNHYGPDTLIDAVLITILKGLDTLEKIYNEINKYTVGEKLTMYELQEFILSNNKIFVVNSLKYSLSDKGIEMANNVCWY